jgi:hypothetical protein
MKVANEIFCDKWCFSVNKPNNPEVEKIEENIRKFRRWAYIIFLANINLEKW